MDFNYTLKYRTFDQLLEDVSIDLNTFALENMIEPQTLIKLVRKINYDLGLRINRIGEKILDVNHNIAKLPDNFDVLNFAFICGEFEESVGYDIGGTNIQEVPYNDWPNQTTTCGCPPDKSCCFEGKQGICITHNPDQPYGDSSQKPRVFLNCKGEAYELIQVVGTHNTRTYKNLIPLKFHSSQRIECDCPNLYYNVPNSAEIIDNHIRANFSTGKIYLNYQTTLEDDDGNLLVPDHALLNEYYEYAVKERLLENLYMNGEDVSQKLGYVQQKLRAARNQALSLVNTPNFKELEKLWWSNRKAMYSKYYDMFKSYSPNNAYYRYIGHNRVM